ncbi:hypothetical protein F66182_11575 [Fusarium sp. NRRL 66182]|nr:hypothetical protein F66182_11575 [Fusarium sp. NRRL 66182]
MTSKTVFDLTHWQVHETEIDCALVFRSTSGQVFYCHILPTKFVQSPAVEETYFKCLEILRTGEVEIDDFYEEDAHDWLFQSFEPLITQLVQCSGVDAVANPTLAHYFFPWQTYNLHLVAVKDEVKPQLIETGHHGWSSPVIKVDNNFLLELNQWTQSYTPSEVHLCYDRPEESLIKTPKRTTVLGQDGRPITCFFKKFGLSFGSSHAKKELEAMKKISTARLPPPPKTYICHLVGVVREENNLLGMLFAWIDGGGVLSEARAAKSSAALKQRWLSQINTSIEQLHDKGIVWGDAKADNILIDRDENAWVIDFGGSYTLGWVDKDKAGTFEGDYQGLGKINDMLRP